MKPGRTPCINPSCRRTADAKEFPGEMICGKCFRALPDRDRKEHRRLWREIRKWERRIAKTVDELKRQRMHDIRNMWVGKLQRHWDESIKGSFANPEKPEGLESFLEEIGL